jgi:FkbM family methyltransferase
MECRLKDAGKVSLEMASARDLAKGELPGFVMRIDGDGTSTDGDTVVIRLPLDADAVWDPDFATIFAATVKLSDGASAREVRLGIGADGPLLVEQPFVMAEPMHVTWTARFPQRPEAPYLQLTIILAAAALPLSVTVSGIFAGHRFDPYVFNPRFRGVAAEAGRPSFPEGAQVLADFERQARLAAKDGSYLGDQAFVQPFLVMREGRPRFPMLVGTANSVLWYALEPRHGIELFADWGLVSDGEVTIDCGAHAGQMAVYFSLIAGPQGRVVAIDPFTQNCLQVEAQDVLNAPGRIRVVRAAVGANRHTLRVANRLQMAAGIEGYPTDDQVEIDVIPLDDFLDIRPTFIKLDVEGAEVDALAGAAELLRVCRPKLMIEGHTQLLGHFGYTVTDLFARIPSDVYDIKFMEEGVDSAWRTYAPGLESGITNPLIILAFPRGVPSSGVVSKPE